MVTAKSKLTHLHQTPDSALYTGAFPTDDMFIETITYNEENYERQQLHSFPLPQADSDQVYWMNIWGLSQSELIQKELLALHIGKMTIEDILHVGQRAKVDFYEHYTYAVMMMLTYKESTQDIQYEQVSFILMDNMLISLQERAGDVFDPIRTRIAQGKSAIRRKSADYLLYTLIDAIVDHYFVLLSVMEDKVEAFERTVINQPKQLKLKDLYELRKRISHLKTTIEPIKELLTQLHHDDSRLSDDTKLYLRDIQDHIHQIIDYTMTYRDMLSNILDTYLSMNSHRMNQIMTTLTIFSAIFIPLTFLAGIYGMNFHNMPELSATWGYPLFWTLSVLITLIMLLYFKIRKWI